jgi:phage baseplate assembly protein W
MIKNNRYIDVDINFTRNSFNNDVSKVVDMTAIQQAVLSIVLTSKGEKPFDYDYGVGIYDYLFENLDYDDIPIIASEVERQLTKYEPRVLFDEIIINQNEYTLDVKINYYVSVKSSGQPPLQSVNLSLTKVR